MTELLAILCTLVYAWVPTSNFELKGILRWRLNFQNLGIRGVGDFVVVVKSMKEHLENETTRNKFVNFFGFQCEFYR